MSKLLKIVSLRKEFKDQVLFDNVSLEIESRGIYGILGASGSGKSSFLYILGLLDNDYKGDIYFLDSNIKSISNKDAFIANNIGFVFQNPVFINEMTVEENLDIINLKDYENRYYLLSRLGLTSLKNKKVKNLSGGERMRLSLVRALLNDPPLLLADEPTAALDNKTSSIVIEFLKEESKKRTVVIVSHDKCLLENSADSILELKHKQFSFLRNIKKEGEIKRHEKVSNKLSLKFMASYLKMAFMRKKWRNVLCVFSLIFSFFTIGFSFLLSTDVASLIKDSFSSLMQKDEIIVESNSVEPKNEWLSITPTEAIDVISNATYFDDYGILYRANFEQMFPESNYLSLLNSEQHLTFYDVGLRRVSEAITLHEISLSTKCYPYTPSTLLDNEVVLGLRKSDIRRISEALNLENRDEASLSTYLETHDIDLCFYFENKQWGYKNEVLITMEAFFVSDYFAITFNDQQDIEDFFEQKMALPVSYDLKRTEYYPWTIKKAIYLKARKEYEASALKEYFSSFLYRMYDFQKVKGDLYSDFLSSSFHQGKYIVTYASRGKISLEEMEELRKEGLIMESLPLGGPYQCIKEAMVTGFKNTIFIAKEESSLEEVILYYDEVSENVDNLDISLVEFGNDISYGNLLTAAKRKGVKFKNTSPAIQKGRLPETENEIMISSKLEKRLFGNDNAVNKRIYISMNNYGIYDRNNFSTSSVMITGVYEDETETIFQEPIWLYIYSVLNLDYPIEDIQFVSYLAKTNNSLNLLEENNNYIFSNPLEDIYQSIDQIMDMLETILIVFTILLGITALGVLFITLQGVMKEVEREIGMMKCLGIKKHSIFILFFTFGIMFSLLAMGGAQLILYFISKVIQVFYFGYPFTFYTSVEPFLIVLLIGGLITIPLSLVKTIGPLKQKAINLLKQYY